MGVYIKGMEMRDPETGRFLNGHNRYEQLKTVEGAEGTLWIEYGGERMQLSYWAERLGLPYHTLYDRLHRYGWPVERAFTEPVRRAL